MNNQSSAHKSLNYYNTHCHIVLHTRGLSNRLPQHVHVCITIQPLTTILLITIHIIHYVHPRDYAINSINAIARGHPSSPWQFSVTHRKPQIIYMIQLSWLFTGWCIWIQEMRTAQQFHGYKRMQWNISNIMWYDCNLSFGAKKIIKHIIMDVKTDGWSHKFSRRFPTN